MLSFSIFVSFFSRLKIGMAFSVNIALSISIELCLSFTVKSTGEGFNSNDMPIGCENLAVMETSEPETGRIAELVEPETRRIAEPGSLLTAEETEVEPETEPELEPATEPELEPVSLLTAVDPVSLLPETEVFESLTELLSSFARPRRSNSSLSPNPSLSCRSPFPSSFSENTWPRPSSCLDSIWERYLVGEGRMVEFENGVDDNVEMILEEDEDVVFIREVKRS